MSIKRIEVASFSKLDAFRFRNTSEVLTALSNILNKVASDEELANSFDPRNASKCLEVSSLEEQPTYDWRSHIPDIGEVDNNFARLSALQELMSQLESIESLVKYKFKDDDLYDSVMSNVAALKTNVAMRMTEYKSLLKSNYESYVTQDFSEFVQRTFDMAHVALNDKARTTSEAKILDVYANNKTSMRYTTYLEFSSLEDVSGFTYKNYCVVATHIKDSSGKDTFYVNTLPGFRAPATFPHGRQVSSVDDAITTLKSLLTSEGFL
ncbi:hypothetical protein GR7B_00094 [Vibrio phage vB_VcorM_GR7B]|nr:hypothetical protein GR7B_00094 [Vibrio phage vB_VcorM_GR7B]